MIIQGKNLIISRLGKALAASKSCTINVNASTIDIAPTSDAQWEESMLQKKSWSVQTKHLVKLPNDPDFWAQAVSHSRDSTKTVSVTTPNGTALDSLTGLHLFLIEENAAPHHVLGVTTYGSPTSCEYFRQQLITVANGQDYPHIVIVSNNQYSLSSDLITTMGEVLGVNTDELTAGDYTDSCLVIISGKKNLIGSAYTIQKTVSDVTTDKMLMNGGKVIHESILKDAVDLVGSKYTLTMELQIPGVISTKISGVAIVQTFVVEGTKGNLMTGSFTWKGSGKLG